MSAPTADPQSAAAAVASNVVNITKNPDRSGYVLTTEFHLPQSRSKIFDFFADAGNLEEITPKWLNFRILTPLPIEMREGARIDYRIKLHGLPIKWKTRITAWEPETRFVDEQISGPYQLWRHEHTFEDDGEGTLCRDRVEYAMIGGALANWLLVRRDLERIFSYRTQRMLELFGG